MKDQVIALAEALRLSRLELDRFRYKAQDLETTIENVERILADPEVSRAIATVESPSIVPQH